MDFNDKFQKMVKYVRGLNGIKDEKVLIPSEVIEGWEDMVLKYSPSYNCGRDEITHRGSSREYFVCNLDSKAEESGISKIATTDTTRQIWPLDVYKSISEKCDDLIKVTNERFDILADSVIMKMVKKALKLPN